MYNINLGNISLIKTKQFIFEFAVWVFLDSGPRPRIPSLYVFLFFYFVVIDQFSIILVPMVFLLPFLVIIFMKSRLSSMVCIASSICCSLSYLDAYVSFWNPPNMWLHSWLVFVATSSYWSRWRNQVASVALILFFGGFLRLFQESQWLLKKTLQKMTGLSCSFVSPMVDSKMNFEMVYYLVFNLKLFLYRWFFDCLVPTTATCGFDSYSFSYVLFPFLF